MMFSPILASVVSAMLGWALAMLSLFLILLILVQRGRGGGLTGALGGPGGQSAFGTKAGDLFTRITSFVALGWIALCAFTMWLIGSHDPGVAVDPTPTVSASPADPRSPNSDMIDFGGGAAAPAAGTENLELTPSQPAAPATEGEASAEPATDEAGAETPAQQADAPSTSSDAAESNENP